MKLALCRAILRNADILLLDEPTNHLDVKNVAWLENFLTSQKTVCPSPCSLNSETSPNLMRHFHSSCMVSLRGRHTRPEARMVSTFHPKPLNPGLSTLNPELSTPNHR